MGRLEEKFKKLNDEISDRYNAKSIEERIELVVYTTEQHCRTLIQILGKYDNYLPKVAKDKINKWLKNSIDCLEYDLEVLKKYEQQN